jgi:hypothetical protein
MLKVEMGPLLQKKCYQKLIDSLSHRAHHLNQIGQPKRSIGDLIGDLAFSPPEFLFAHRMMLSLVFASTGPVVPMAQLVRARSPILTRASSYSLPALLFTRISDWDSGLGRISSPASYACFLLPGRAKVNEIRAEIWADFNLNCATQATWHDEDNIQAGLS